MAGAGRRARPARISLVARVSALTLVLLLTAPAGHSAIPVSGNFAGSSTAQVPLALSPARSSATLTDDTSVQIYQSGSGVGLVRIDGSGSLIAGPTQVATATETAALSLGPASSALVAARESAGLVVAKVALSPIGPVASQTLDSYGAAPALASSPSEYGAAWLHVSPGTSEVRFASSADGTSWSSSLPVASTSAGARAGVAYSPSGAVVVIADGGTLSLYAKSGGGFLPPTVISQIQGNTFSLVGQPLSISYESPQGVFVAIDSDSGFVLTKVASNQESQPSLGATANGLVLTTASSEGVIRRHMQGGAWSAPIIEVSQPGAFGPQVGEKSGPSRNGVIWASPAGGGSEVRSAALDVAPPVGQWLYPREHSVIGGVISLSLVITDDVAIATEPTYYIAPESAPSDELGTNIDQIHGPPPWVPGPPPTQPPPGAGGGGRRGGSGNPPPAAANPEPPPPAISDAGQGVVYERDFDTRQVPDGEYRFAATAEDTSLNQMREVLDPIIDNTPPTVGIDLPATDTLVTSSVGVFGTVTDLTLAGWQFRAETTSTAPVVIAGGTAPVISDLLGTFETSMLPASYSGYVYLVLVATDSAEPSPNTASYARRIQADDPRDAFGILRNSPSYEISATVPITADISGAVASWQLDGFKAGETTPGITAPSYTSSGTTSGNGVVVGSWDVANRWGTGDVTFRLTTNDTGGDAFVDTKASVFSWRTLELAITSPYLNGELSGTIPVDGYIRGSNVWAWAIGVPISDTNPAFSPDGRRVVFESSRENLFGKDIWIVNTDGSGLTRLTGQPDPTGQTDVSYGGFNGSPSFTPDGAEIVFYSIRSGNHEIYVMGDDGTNVRNLTNNPAHDMFPAVSPDGSKIAFVSDRTGEDAIWLMDIDGSNQTLVADVVGDRSHMPDFSPDGKRLVFDGGTGGIQQIYFVYLTDTANPIQLTTAADALFSANPAYSPDGTRIAFASPRVLGENPHIFVMNADGTNVVQYTSTSTGEDDAVFSPDFGLLAFSSAQSGSLEIYLMTDTPFATPVRLTAESSIFGIHDRLPGFSTLRYPFPPAPTANTSTKVDVAAFLEGSYQFPVPDQFPTGERPTDGLLGHLNTAKLKPGVNSIELVAIQCPSAPPPFIFRVPRQYEQETSDTIAALASCSASSFRQTIRVAVTSAHVEVSFTDNMAGTGYAGPLAVTDTFYARGSWTPSDNWSLGPSPFKPDRGPSPALVRTSGRMWAKGPAASDGNSYVPVGDPLALEDIKAIMNQPAAGLEALAGTPPTAYPAEQFAPGRAGTRYEVEVPPTPEHFGGTLRIVAWEDSELDVLGAIQYSYTDVWSGPETDLPAIGQAWGPKKGTEETTGVRIVFSRYNSDEENTVPPVPEAGQ